jgi:mono/diheme cytochrome c family protein
MAHFRIARSIPWLGALVAAGLIGVVAVPTTVRAQPAPPLGDGKAVFDAQKCQTCHSVSKAGIESKTKSGKLFGGDLSAVAAKLDPAWAAKFIKGDEKKDGEIHKKKSTATDADLAALIAWLKTQAL